MGRAARRAAGPRPRGRRARHHRRRRPAVRVALRRPRGAAGARRARRWTGRARRPLRGGLPAAAARCCAAGRSGPRLGVPLPGRGAATRPAREPAGPAARRDRRRGARAGRAAGRAPGRWRDLSRLDRRGPARGDHRRQHPGGAGALDPATGPGLLHRTGAGGSGLARGTVRLPAALLVLRRAGPAGGPARLAGGRQRGATGPAATSPRWWSPTGSADDLEALLARL